MKYQILIFAFGLITCKTESKSTFENKVQTIDAVKDTINEIVFSVKGKPKDNEIGYDDVFNNHVFINQGKASINSPQIIKDSHWKHQTQFLISKSIHNLIFEIGQDGFWLFKSDDKTIENELNFDVAFRRQIAPITNITDILWLNTNIGFYNKTTERSTKIDTYFDKKMIFLEDYAKKYNLSKKFKDDWKRLIKYERISVVMQLGNGLSKWNSNYLQDIVEQNIVELNNDSLLYIPDYQKSLQLIVPIISFLKTKKNTPALSKYSQIIKDNFKRKTKDYLECMLLLQTLDTKNNFEFTKNEFENLKIDFLSTCTVSEYKKYIEKSFTAPSNTLKNNNVLNLKNESNSLKELCTNKITYIDFWASWCAPCRTEMPDSKKLQKDYANKGINFIYISTDENPAAWERASKKIELSESESYLLPKNSSLTKQFKITSIPRYMIISKDGKVINADAPRPSDPKIRKIFDDLLKN
jgi:thiol-disulfide isomerase/thioredoxin